MSEAPPSDEPPVPEPAPKKRRKKARAPDPTEGGGAESAPPAENPNPDPGAAEAPPDRRPARKPIAEERPRVDDGRSDIERLYTRLGEIEQAAQGQEWDKERPWRRSTHLWEEDGLPILDLHDLGSKLARRAVEISAGEARDLRAAAVGYITGQGKHSKGMPVLGKVVTDAVTARIRADGGRLRPLGPGRLVYIQDPARAPRRATGQLGLGSWLIIAMILALLLWVCSGTPGIGR
jgi:hypothetical protein